MARSLIIHDPKVCIYDRIDTNDQKEQTCSDDENPLLSLAYMRQDPFGTDTKLVWTRLAFIRDPNGFTCESDPVLNYDTETV